MRDVKRWKCDCEFIGTDFVADRIEAVRASDYDALAAERDRLRTLLGEGRSYMNHTTSCRSWMHMKGCTCGFKSYLAKLEAEVIK